MFSLMDMFFGSYAGDLAIDLGTANTLVSVRGKGIVIREPSVVAIDKNDERILAVGIEAKRMLGRTPGNIVAVRPLKDGVIADFDVTEAMLRYFIDKASEKRYPWTPRPRVVVCVPSGVTSVEKRAVFEATIQAGARRAYGSCYRRRPARRGTHRLHGHRHRRRYHRGCRYRYGRHCRFAVHSYCR